jgi:hypothetical protein
MVNITLAPGEGFPATPSLSLLVKEATMTNTKETAYHGKSGK